MGEMDPSNSVNCHDFQQLLSRFPSKLHLGWRVNFEMIEVLRAGSSFMWLNTSFFCAQLGSHRSGAPLILQTLMIIAASLSIGAAAAHAQSKGIYQQGDAVVTGFSGVSQMKFPTDAKPDDY